MFQNRKKKEVPAIQGSALPDIVFMLLFFFMVATVMRDQEMKVKISLPTATQVEKLTDKSLVNYILIGPPLDTARYGSEPLIQLNDQYAELVDIAPFIELKREETIEAKRKALITALKVDENTKMGIVTDVKQELRHVQSFKINYNTIGSGGKGSSDFDD